MSNVINLLTPGSTLKNGATVLAAKAGRTDESIVLALAPGSYHPFVVWRVSNTTLDAFHGDYHSTLEEAVVAYSERT